ncbi:MAG: hypothetical protein J0653_07640, partial [Deltaproteobacteria bacterium]|nr:hypothetical protein [Deltaproteobacteria bacterium]
SAWDYSGTFGLAAEGGWSYSRQLLTPPVPPAIPPIPYYFKGKFEISVDGSVNITDAISKKQFNGELNIAPKLTGTAGLGVNEMFGLEGTGSGTLTWQPHWNEDDTIKLSSEFSIRVFALMFQKEWLWPAGEWCVRGCDSVEQ